jgi:phage terminase small subunit
MGRKPGGTSQGPSRRDPETGLTRHQVVYVAACTEGLTYVDAYKRAYSCDKLLPDEVKRRAWELSRDPNVMAEFARIRERAREAAGYTVADAVHEAEMVRLMAMEDRVPAAATGAITLKTKLLGLLTDKIEQKTTTVPATLPELESQLRDVMRQLGLQAPDDLADIAKDNVIPITKRA